MGVSCGEQISSCSSTEMAVPNARIGTYWCGVSAVQELAVNNFESAGESRSAVTITSPSRPSHEFIQTV